MTEQELAVGESILSAAPGAEATSYLPGCIRALDLRPTPKWPVALRNTRALHGTLTNVWGRPHNRREPNFLLLPWRGGCGWAAQWLVEGAEALASRQEVSIFNAPRLLTLGPPMRLKLPSCPPEGMHLLCLDTVTPVLIRHSEKPRSTADATNLLSAMHNSATMERALGRAVDIAPAALDVVASDTKPARVQTGGNWGGCGFVVGWEGRLVLRANAYARRLLEVAQLIGLGGRTSLGFGRFRLREAKP